MTFRKRKARAHRSKGLANTLHRAAREGFIADECEISILRSKKARDHAHCRPGVAAIERVICGRYMATYAGDFNRTVLALADIRAKRLHAGQC